MLLFEFLVGMFSHIVTKFWTFPFRNAKNWVVTKSTAKAGDRSGHNKRNPVKKKKKKKKKGGGGGGIGEHISALDRKTKQQTINQTNKTTAVTTTTTDQEKNTLQVQSRDFAIKALLHISC